MFTVSLVPFPAVEGKTRNLQEALRMSSFEMSGAVFCIIGPYSLEVQMITLSYGGAFWNVARNTRSVFEPGQ